MSKKKNEIIKTPVGTVKFAHLSKPNTKFKKDGVYSVDVLFDPEQVTDLKTKLNETLAAAAKEFIAKDAKLKKYTIVEPFADDEDKDGNATGKVLFKFKKSASYTDDKTKEVIDKPMKLFDAKTNDITGTNVGRESTVRVAFSVLPYHNASSKTIGLSLRLYQVQVLNLVEFGGGCAFDAEEGEFGADEEADAEANSSNADGGNSDDF